MPLQHHRSVVRDWLRHQELEVSEVEKDEQWVNVELLDRSPSLADANPHSSSASNVILPWPLQYILVRSPLNSIDRHKDLRSFLSDQPDTFHLALDGEKYGERPRNTTQETGDLQYPPIPTDLCRDLRGASPAPTPTPDVLMRDSVLESQAAIYPTPSDGLTSHQTPASFNQDSPYVGSSQAQDSQILGSISDTSGRADLAANQDIQGVPTVQSSAKDGAGSQIFPGLTEDDFSFFDNPQHMRELSESGNEDRKHDAGEGLDRTSQTKDGSTEHNAVVNNITGSDATWSAREKTLDSGLERDEEVAELKTSVSTEYITQPEERWSTNWDALNAKYGRNGLFVPNKHQARFTDSKSVDANSRRMPHVGLPSDTSSSYETDASQSDTASDDFAAVREGQGKDAQAQNDKPVARIELSPEDKLQQMDTARVRDFLQAQALIQGDRWCSKLFHNGTPSVWDNLDWLLGDLDPHVGINLIQDLTEQIVCSINPSTVQTERNVPVSTCDTDLSFIPTQLLALALTSNVSIDLLKGSLMNKPNVSQMTPEIRRSEQEIRTQLRQALTQLEAPHLQVQRHGNRYSMLPAAVQFHESLGLGPISGPKDVTTFVVSPLQRNAADGVELFHNILKDAYMSQQLGACHAGFQDTNATGHVPVSGLRETSSLLEFTSRYNQACEDLASQLSINNFKKTSIMVFLADPRGDEASMLALSTSFQRLVQRCRASCKTCSELSGSEAICHGNIKYLIIPSAFVDLDYSISLPALSPSVRSQLASRVYNLIGHKIASSGLFENMVDTRPALELDRVLPSSIPFELATDTPQHLLSQDSALHIAYSFSDRNNWLVTSWVDNTGRYQAQRTYPLKHQDLSTILDEVWQSTLAILQNTVGRQIRWRVFLAKVGCFLPDEFKKWSEVIGDQPSNVSIYLLSVETSPKFSVDITDSFVAPTESPPNSTAAAFQSPSASTTAATPDNSAAPELDPEARIIDMTDQTWSMLLAFQPNTAANSSYYLPAVASALLIKRRSQLNHSPPAILQVNLLRVFAGNQQRERAVPEPRNVLKDVLKMYSDLGVLARARCEEAKDSARPLHIGLVEKAVAGLDRIIEL
ncbi:MAG: hypothetical protein Q9159_001442 [Coniocarpon cinnabarinum]